MTLSEFHAWLEGYSASFKDDCPNAEQWAAIKAKLSTVQPIMIDKMKFPEVLGPSTGARPYWLDLPVGVSALS